MIININSALYIIEKFYDWGIKQNLLTILWFFPVYSILWLILFPVHICLVFIFGTWMFIKNGEVSDGKDTCDRQ